MRWLSLLNLALAAAIVLIVTFCFLAPQKDEIPTFSSFTVPKELPKSPYAQADEFFQEIGESLFTLKWVPPQMQLPDMRHELLFYGKNARPDVTAGATSFHFLLKGSQENAVVREGERTYLVYKGNYSPKGRAWDMAGDSFTASPQPLWGDISTTDDIPKDPYVFSPGNQPTPLWFEVKSVGEQKIEVRISMLDEKGALVLAPADLRTFQLQAQEFPKTQPQAWQIGGFRVDATLLVRQRARWVGPDLFLTLHGGEEFAHAIGKERIDFCDGPNAYSCFVGVGDFLIWKDEKWRMTNPGVDSQHFPLLVVKKIDDKILTFELWDPEGKGKIPLSLVRVKEHTTMPNLAQEFKFVGAKTWAQFIVESRQGERLTLRPHDWLVCTPEGWIKLDSASQIDAFVEQSLTGPLFVLEKMDKKNGRQVLIGHLFNTMRTEVEEVELTAATPAPLANYYRHNTAPTPYPSQFAVAGRLQE